MAKTQCKTETEATTSSWNQWTASLGSIYYFCFFVYFQGVVGKKRMILAE